MPRECKAKRTLAGTSHKMGNAISSAFDTVKNVFVGAYNTVGNIVKVVKNPQVVTYDQSTELFSKQITSIVNKRIQKCIAPIQASQFISVTCNPAPELVAAFENTVACQTCRALNSNLDPGEQNANCPICFACVTADLQQNLTLVADFNACAPFGPDVAEVSQQISQDIQEQIINNTSTQSLFDTWWNGTPKRVNKTQFQSQVQNLIEASDITVIMFACQTQQAIVITSTGGSTQSGVTQAVLQYQISNVVANKLQQINVDNATNIADATVSDATKAQDSQLLTYNIVLITLSVIVLLLLIIMAYLTFRKAKKSKAPRVVYI